MTRAEHALSRRLNIASLVCGVGTSDSRADGRPHVGFLGPIAGLGAARMRTEGAASTP